MRDGINVQHKANGRKEETETKKNENNSARKKEKNNVGGRGCVVVSADFFVCLQNGFSKKSDGEVADVRLPLGRQLEELDIVPFHSINHHCSTKREFISTNQTGRTSEGDSPLSREWCVLAWHTSRLIPSTT